MSVLTTEMILNAVKAEYGHTFVHLEHEFSSWLKDEGRRMVEDYEGLDGQDRWSPYG